MRNLRRIPPSLLRVFRNPAIFCAACCRSSMGITDKYRRGGRGMGSHPQKNAPRLRPAAETDAAWIIGYDAFFRLFWVRSTLIGLPARSCLIGPLSMRGARIGMGGKMPLQHARQTNRWILS